jgi:hypothetical protein
MSIMRTIIKKANSIAMHNPPHPGGIIRRQCLEPLGIRRESVGCHATGAVRRCQRKGRRIGRDGDPAVEGVWLQSGDVARNADGLRPLAGSQPNRENPGALIQGLVKSLRTLHPRERLP